MRNTSIPGCVELFPDVREDDRGRFVKTFQRNVFCEWALRTSFAEEFFSTSRKGVLRGLHFQVPPYALNKLVYCLEGRALDAVVDLRRGSPTFGQHEMFELNGKLVNMLYLAPGLAHGFYALTENVIMAYKTTELYSPEHDKGVLWNSAGISWPDIHPILSDRDKMFPPLAEFNSPFIFQEGKR